MEINTDISATQFAKFAIVAKANNKTISAYLREVIKFIGDNAEITSKKDNNNELLSG